MPRVDFYVLSEETADARLRCACRLIEKATDLDHRVYVQTNSVDLSRRIDDLLWTYSDRTFLPHDVWNGETPDALSKVLIGEQDAPDSHRQLLVNLADQAPANLDSYTRIIEIVDADPERKRLSRERYKLYREKGCALETHNL
ncbi:MAG TPA: DNA polymerase III subunit chi [Steroidobacteraceae bacterium]|nr:DNA polymerase III subunit chi [Steroidobacteraceae bacterium]